MGAVNPQDGSNEARYAGYGRGQGLLASSCACWHIPTPRDPPAQEASTDR